MSTLRKRAGFGGVIYVSIVSLLAMYFTYGAVQGEYGLFRRVQIDAEIAVLREELAALRAELAVLENKNRRLSDTYLDLDLLDEQARRILGLMRPDELVVR